MSENTNWAAVARARALDIPEESLERIAPALQALHQAFDKLLPDLPYHIEPSITLSEAAVLGQTQAGAE